MTTLPVRHVALFRGINVGRAKRIAMADLSRLLGTLGYTDVKTLLNSGNAVFSATGGNASEHAERICAAVAKKLGVDALVVVKTARDIQAALAGNTLLARMEDPSRLLVALTHDAASLSALKSLATADLVVGKDAAYLWCPLGISKTPLAEVLLKRLDGSGTTRNWATVQKIAGLLASQK